MKYIFVILFLFCYQSTTIAQLTLTTKNQFSDFGVTHNNTVYKNKKCLQVKGLNADEGGIVMIHDYLLQDGIIEIEVAGAPIPGTDTSYRGFIGLAFRAMNEPLKFECFYLRPTNGRANDQLRRNHTTQYISHPDYPWHLLRKNSPGVYESYTDIVSGEWTKMRIHVKGQQAQLYVGNASQPCLIVNDLKLTPQKGKLALWIGPGTNGYFRGLKVIATDR